MRAAPPRAEQLAPATRAHGQRQDDAPEGHALSNIWACPMLEAASRFATACL